MCLVDCVSGNHGLFSSARTGARRGCCHMPRLLPSSVHVSAWLEVHLSASNTTCAAAFSCCPGPNMMVFNRLPPAWCPHAAAPGLSLPWTVLSSRQDQPSLPMERSWHVLPVYTRRKFSTATAGFNTGSGPKQPKDLLTTTPTPV